jgi:hypothetical protein
MIVASPFRASRPVTGETFPVAVHRPNNLWSQPIVREEPGATHQINRSPRDEATQFALLALKAVHPRGEAPAIINNARVSSSQASSSTTSSATAARAGAVCRPDLTGHDAG